MTRYLSLFAGIEAASCAWEPMGWTPVAVAEIEPFPCSLLAHHFPGVPNARHAQVLAWRPSDHYIYRPERFERLARDAAHVAEKRAGLAGDRSGLFNEQREDLA